MNDAGAIPVPRDAATVIVIRDPAGSAPSVLMGQRGATAAFMPDSFVFPGGAVDPGDADVTLLGAINDACALRLADETPARIVRALAAAAIRELWEETGLIFGEAGHWPDAPPGWEGFAARGLRPSASALRYFFRAVTPPDRSRRFDARFFMADAANLAADPDDFSRASGELSSLQWVPLHAARDFPLPLVTQVALKAAAAALPSLEPPAKIPFLRHGAFAYLAGPEGRAAR